MDRKRQWFEDEERGEKIEEKKKKPKKAMLLTTRMHGVYKALEKEQRSEVTQIKHKKKLYTYLLKSVK